jgi:site-specific DNA-methyltransferase (adenine-specific)
VPLPRGDLEFGRQRVFLASSEAMPQLSDGSVDVIVTSPPYNRGKRYGKAYDDRMPAAEYHALLFRVFRECHRVLSDRGAFFLNIGDAARDQGKSERVARWAEEAGFHRLQTLVWVKTVLGKGHFTPSGQGRRFSNVFEYVFLFAKGPSPRLDVKRVGIPYADKSNIGRYGSTDLRDAGNVWFVPYRETTGATVKKGHEAPFPVELPWRAIRCVPGARRVLDPFAGTGSTLAAAESLGVEGVGYEPHTPPAVIRRRLRTPFVPPTVQLIPELERALLALAEAEPGLLRPSRRGRTRKHHEGLVLARRLVAELSGARATRRRPRGPRAGRAPASGRSARSRSPSRAPRPG